MRCFAVVVALMPTLGAASSPAAWAEFRAEVEGKCRALIEAPEGARVQIEVSPEGSTRYGAALITLGDPAGGAERMVCVMDKQTREAELATPFAAFEAEGSAGGGMGQAQISGETAGGAPVAEAAGTEVGTGAETGAGAGAGAGAGTGSEVGSAAPATEVVSPADTPVGPTPPVPKPGG